MSSPGPDPRRSFEARRQPALGGFNLTFLGIEIRRLLRNRRTFVLTLVVPVVLFLLLRPTSERSRSAASRLRRRRR